MSPKLSLAVVWTEDGTTLLPGRLELVGTRLHLAGGGRDGERTREIELHAIASTRLGRTAADRVGGRLTLVIELLDGGVVRIAGFERPGALRELADCLHAAAG
jgi:hypothetical protein